MVLPLQISQICDDDVPAVVSLWQSCELTRPWNNPITDIAFARAQENSDVLVGRASAEGEILASVMVGHDGHRGWVYYLAVSPDCQGAGYGKAMMAACEQWQLDRGIWKLQLMVRAGNKPVLAFYDRLDYGLSDTQLLEKWIDPSKRGDA